MSYALLPACQNIDLVANYASSATVNLGTNIAGMTLLAATSNQVGDASQLVPLAVTVVNAATGVVSVSVDSSSNFQPSGSMQWRLYTTTGLGAGCTSRTLVSGTLRMLSARDYVLASDYSITALSLECLSVPLNLGVNLAGLTIYAAVVFVESIGSGGKQILSASSGFFFDQVIAPTVSVTNAATGAVTLEMTAAQTYQAWLNLAAAFYNGNNGETFNASSAYWIISTSPSIGVRPTIRAGGSFSSRNPFTTCASGAAVVSAPSPGSSPAEESVESVYL